MKGRKWARSAAIAAAFLGGLGAAVIPAAANQLTITLPGGSTLAVPVDLPPGVSVPGLSGNSTPASPTAPVGVPVAPSAPVAPPSAGAPAAHRPHGRGSAIQRHSKTTSGESSGPLAASRTQVPSVAPVAPVLPGGLRQVNGVPTLGNPSLSLALPGAAPLGVPDFFIDTFRIPPFLLPIYQAAGTQYGVPWQVLAAINEIETDYGRNLSISSAGAEGWMQFLPKTFAQYGVDANGDGRKDPYNPEDAIFTAARYLQAAGAARDLRGAIFAYNHAQWYVQSVLLRAKLIGGLPAELVGSLSGLTQGRFPVAAPARYADDMREAARKSSARLKDAALPRRNASNIYARPGAPVIAAQDARVLSMGQSSARGRYLILQDGYGNRYDYEQLGAVAASYPTLGDVPRDPRADSGAGPPAAPVIAPNAPATAGAHSLAPPSASATAGQAGASAPSDPLAVAVANVRERLFANPARPKAFAAGGRDQLDRTRPLAGGPRLPGLLSQALALPGQSVNYRPLAAGAHVLAGTILGRIGPGQAGVAPHLRFAIRPAGPGSPAVDPKPILDGWKLLEATAVYRAAGQNSVISGPLAVGRIFLAGRGELERTVLADPHIDLVSCARRDVAGGLVDRRVLATIAYLSASGVRPRISALACGQNPADATGAAAGAPSALAALGAPSKSRTAKGGPTTTAATPGPIAGTLSGITPHTKAAPPPLDEALDIAAVDGIPIQGHQGAGSISDVTIRRLLALQGAYRPHEIVSLMHYPGSDNTIALPDHANRIHVAFSSLIASDPAHLSTLDTALRPDQWIKLIGRLNAIPEPSAFGPGTTTSGSRSAGLLGLPGLGALPAVPGRAGGAPPTPTP